jgi:peroxiredoxin
LPSLENLHQNFKDKPFSLLAIDVGEKKETVLRFVEKNKLSFTFLLDKDGQVSAQYGVRSHPMKFLIDRNGKLIGVSRGYREWDTEAMKSLIQQLINDTSI